MVISKATDNSPVITTTIPVNLAVRNTQLGAGVASTMSEKFTLRSRQISSDA